MAYSILDSNTSTHLACKSFEVIRGVNASLFTIRTPVRAEACHDVPCDLSTTVNSNGNLLDVSELKNCC